MFNNRILTALNVFFIVSWAGMDCFFGQVDIHILDILCCATDDRQIKIHTKAPPVFRVGG